MIRRWLKGAVEVVRWIAAEIRDRLTRPSK